MAVVVKRDDDVGRAPVGYQHLRDHEGRNHDRDVWKDHLKNLTEGGGTEGDYDGGCRRPGGQSGILDALDRNAIVLIESHHELAKKRAAWRNDDRQQKESRKRSESSSLRLPGPRNSQFGQWNRPIRRARTARTPAWTSERRKTC
ncbi:hypothetical protein E4U51_005241 [Claviceps purpurea]|nr:hypothetical protein E4U51_005241 [Claviceps purpurea]KAG6261795.1 hypothetical protein E4U49_003598 [Claviceps purpurea]